MASLVTTLIATACLNMSGEAKEACQHGLNAGAKQSGIEQTVNTAQKKAEKIAKKEVSETIGKTSLDVIGSSLFLAKAISDKSVAASVPTMGIADKIRLEVGENKHSIKMEWQFP